jgi:hypothetical protein
MTRKRRYLISAAVLAACVGIAFGVLAMLPPRPGVTKANFDRIEKGMTREDVEVLFGGKGDWRWIVGDWEVKSEWMWRDNDGVEATINFENDCVTKKQWSGSDETIPDKLRRWLHLPK